MIFEVIKKEIVSSLTTPKVVITYAVCSALIITAVLTGAINYVSLKEEIFQQVKAEKDRLKNINNYMMDYLQTGIGLFREPDLLSVLVFGVEGDAAQRGTINYYVYPDYDVSKFNNTPILAVFGMLDLEFIVKIILSLFAILFTYDAISGEKELGTLKLNFTSDMKRSSFLIGKLVGNFVVLILPFIIPLLLGLLILQFIPGLQFAGEDWSRVSLLILAFGLYILVFFSMGIMVSSFTSRPTVSFLVLLMLWVLIISIVPRAAVLTAQSIKSVPTADEATREYSSAVGQSYKTFIGTINKEIKDFLDEFDPRQIDPARQQKILDEIMKAHDEFATDIQKKGQTIYEDMDKKQEEQNKLAISLCRVTSPAAALTFAATSMAKSGVSSSDTVFKNNVVEISKSFRANTKEEIDKNPGLLQGGGSLQQVKMNKSDLYPADKDFPAQSFDEAVYGSLQDYAILALLSIIFIAVSFVAFIRYDVR